VAFEYSAGVVHGADRPFLQNIRQLDGSERASYPPACLVGTDYRRVNSVMRGYRNHAHRRLRGAYQRRESVSTLTADLYDLAAPNVMQHDRGLGPKGINISNNCRRFQVAMGQFFAPPIQVPPTEVQCARARHVQRDGTISRLLVSSTSGILSPRRDRRRFPGPGKIRPGAD